MVLLFELPSFFTSFFVSSTLFYMKMNEYTEAKHKAYLRAHQRALECVAAHPELASRGKLIQDTPDESDLFDLLDDVASHGIPYPPHIPVLLYTRMILEELAANIPAQRRFNPVRTLIRKLFARERL